MKLLGHSLLLLLALFLIPTVADAGVRVSMSEQIDPAADVVFETKIRYVGLHSYNHKNLGADLIKAGESKDLTVLAVVPVWFESVYTNAFQLAYYTDLNPRLGLDKNISYVKRCSPSFSNKAKDGLQLQRK